MTEEEYQSFFSEKQKLHEGLSEFSWQQYLMFLTNNDLVKIVDRRISVSEVGDDYLLFLHRYRLSSSKVL
jgi:hypothetical protein